MPARSTATGLGAGPSWRAGIGMRRLHASIDSLLEVRRVGVGSHYAADTLVVGPRILRGPEPDKNMGVRQALANAPDQVVQRRRATDDFEVADANHGNAIGVERGHGLSRRSPVRGDATSDPRLANMADAASSSGPLPARHRTGAGPRHSGARSAAAGASPLGAAGCGTKRSARVATAAAAALSVGLGSRSS